MTRRATVTAALALALGACGGQATHSKSAPTTTVAPIYTITGTRYPWDRKEGDHGQAALSYQIEPSRWPLRHLIPKAEVTSNETMYGIAFMEGSLMGF